MSLIENLEQNGWSAFLRSCFEHTLELMATDRFRWSGSSVDDLKSWLAAGGVNRVKLHLNNQMNDCRFSSAHKEAVNEVLEELIRENQHKISSLVASGTIPSDLHT